jgi:uncharacterized sulfatase
MPHKPLAASDHFYTPETPDDLYGDVIAELDWSVGQVLSKLKQLDLDKRTLTIFTSDNGPWYGGSTGGLRGMKGRTWEGGLRVPMIARMPGVIPPGVVNRHPAATVDVLPTVCRLAAAPLPEARVLDGRDIMPMLQNSNAKSPHDAIFGMQGERLATIRSGDWKLHVLNPGPVRYNNAPPEQLLAWVDPRGPNGVQILAPFEQAKLTQYPGVTTGDEPKAMMLFNLATDPAEQHNVADQHPDVVQRLLAKFEKARSEIPEFPAPKSDYLLQPPPKGRPRTLMRLIGGALRYDRIPKPQQHLLAKPLADPESGG